MSDAGGGAVSYVEYVEDEVAAGAWLWHFLWRPFLHDGDGLGDGDGLDHDHDGDEDGLAGFFVGVATGFVVRGAEVAGFAGFSGALDAWRGRCVRSTSVGVGTAVAAVDGLVTVRRGVGLSLTSTCRVCLSPGWNVVWTTDSGRAWRPTTASSPVAAVASTTMTRLESSGPRCFVLLTVATSPWGSRCGWFRVLLRQSDQRTVPV